MQKTALACWAPANKDTQDCYLSPAPSTIQTTEQTENSESRFWMCDGHFSLRGVQSRAWRVFAATWSHWQSVSWFWRNYWTDLFLSHFHHRTLSCTIDASGFPTASLFPADCQENNTSTSLTSKGNIVLHYIKTSSACWVLLTLVNTTRPSLVILNLPKLS